ncbi:MAG TPA: metallophosphoesterase [Hyphomicrobium sp.]|nr:metallophosphoesterase [Hyphomicrobium sp.]
MQTPFTLAHFSDVHLSPVVGFGPRHWNAKRTLGFLNWQRARKRVHHKSVADRLLADAMALRADHVAITGDLINLGLPSEYEAALAWLQSVGPPDSVTVVPGNHDVYTHLAGHAGIARWAAYMGSEEQSLAFPFVRRVGPLALIGLNSAIETPPFVAAGRLGAHQIEVAGEMLERLAEEDVIRVVLIHHPPLPGLASRRRALADAAQFTRVLERAGAELVLYGHNHRERLNWHVEAERRTGAPPIPVIGVPSASAASYHRDEPLGRYNIFTFFEGDEGLRIRYSVRGLETPGGDIVKLSETILEMPA